MGTLTHALDWVGLWWRPRADRASIRSFRERRLRQLVAHAFGRVPYYRKLFDKAGLRPQDVRTLDDLPLIPITTKRDVQQAPLEERIARGVEPDRCVRSITSGSTGEPAVVLRSSTETQVLHAYRLRAQILSGLRPADRRVFLRGNPSRKPRFYDRLRLFEQVEVDSCLDAPDILALLAPLQPDVVRGQPQTLSRLAEVAGDSDLAHVRPRLIFSGADTLTPQFRRRISEAFGSTIVDFYGTDEFDLLAWECKRCGQYHTCDDSVIVEIVAGGQVAEPGQEGRVIVTGLHSLAMPFLRFDVGDIARRPVERAPCPIGFESMEQPLGRSRDFLPLPGGGALSPSSILLGLEELEGLGRFQVVQTALDEVIVYYEPLPGYAGNLAARIERRCRQIFPARLSFQTRSAGESILWAEKRRVIQAYTGAKL